MNCRSKSAYLSVGSPSAVSRKSTRVTIKTIVILRIEATVSIGKAALRCRELNKCLVLKIEGPNPLDCGCDLLSVSANILNRGSAHRARIPARHSTPHSCPGPFARQSRPSPRLHIPCRPVCPNSSGRPEPESASTASVPRSPPGAPAHRIPNLTPAGCCPRPAQKADAPHPRPVGCLHNLFLARSLDKPACRAPMPMV